MAADMSQEHELDLLLAGELQRALLPRSCPSCWPHYKAAARSRMCASVGGDFHDFIHINPDQIAVVIGDAMGHGVRAALVMAQILGFLRLERERLPRPTQIISALNRMLIGLGERIDATVTCSLFYGVFDAPSGLAVFVNAGHPRPYLCDRRGGTANTIGSNDVLLGVEEFKPEEMCHTFESGERLVLYTDGVTDAGDSAQNRFGRGRLQRLICRNSAAGPEALAEALVAEVDEFRKDAPRIDDETIVVLDRM